MVERNPTKIPGNNINHFLDENVVSKYRNSRIYLQLAVNMISG
jgi:hypothetical protein